MSTMSDRFQRARWSLTRVKIHDMIAGQTLWFDPSQYFSVKSSVERLNEGYEGEATWKYKSFTVMDKPKFTKVTRTT